MSQRVTQRNSIVVAVVADLSKPLPKYFASSFVLVSVHTAVMQGSYFVRLLNNDASPEELVKQWQHNTEEQDE